MFEVIKGDNGFMVDGDATGKVYTDESKAKRRSRDLIRAAKVAEAVEAVEPVNHAADPVKAMMVAERPVMTSKVNGGVYPYMSKTRHVRRAYA